MIFERFIQWLAERERQRCFNSHRPYPNPPGGFSGFTQCVACHTPHNRWHRWSCNFARHVDIDAYAKQTDQLGP